MQQGMDRAIRNIQFRMNVISTGKYVYNLLQGSHQHNSSMAARCYRVFIGMDVIYRMAIYWSNRYLSSKAQRRGV
jgi:hypothetical protein